MCFERTQFIPFQIDKEFRMTERTSTTKKLDELYELINSIDIAMMTTRRSDGLLVSRPMATQRCESVADIWFVTSIDTHKIEELERDPHVALAYYNDKTKEWVSVSGLASITQDRKKIRELYKPDWKAWFDDQGNGKDGGPEDPRLALILVEAVTAHYMKSKHSRPRTIFEIATGVLTGTKPDVGREEHLNTSELR